LSRSSSAASRPIDCSELRKRQQESLHVVLGTIVDEIEILGVHRYALQNGSYASHDNEANFVSIEDFNQSKESVFQAPLTLSAS
jgi:hypothetical protein